MEDSQINDYDYCLPESLIAQHPLEDRASARLLHVSIAEGSISHRRFEDIVDILNPDDLLVMNDTRVSARRLFGKKPTGGEVEALLLSEVGRGEYLALLKPGRRLRPGAKIFFEGDLAAEVVEERDDGAKRIRFEPVEGLRERIANSGMVPLPPYIHERLANPDRYQTVYAANDGSAAAPTAGLHFTEALLQSLDRIGVKRASVTLDVSIDTFRPVQVNNLDDHRMHGEACRVPAETAEAVRNCKGRVIAVGTTTVRTLETLAIGHRQLSAATTVSKLFIRPGYRFQIIDGMFTNFHMPKTTMMMMLSALIGRQKLLDAYAEAIQQNYRFLSFGDSMLLL